MFCEPFPAAALSTAWICNRSFADTVVSNPAGVNGCLPVVSVMCCQVVVMATSLSFVLWIPINCGASLCVIYRPQI